jgi:ribonucleoside-diphosphate reductase alpha chain
MSIKREDRFKSVTKNALEVLKARYLLKNEKGKIIENPSGMFRRVARAIALDRKQEHEFYEIMSSLEFLPNSPTLFNAGAPLKQLAACFVLPVNDSLDSIFTAVKNMALIEQTGGGVGFDFSKLRPKGDLVKSTKGVASGPVSFMRVFNSATEIIKAGGKRRGAMMAVLHVTHPDIIEFISAKNKPGELANFNISVAVTDDFMRAVKADRTYPLINPRTKQKVVDINARKIWDKIIKNAWNTGDPGIIFIDEINRHNPTPFLGEMTGTNPCGEVPLLPYESCNLGSINMSRMVTGGKINWHKLEYTIKLAVNFLDNVIGKNKYPLSQIEQITKANRKIGLGIMGWAECLIRMKIPYDSGRAVKLAEKTMLFIQKTAREESMELADKKGNFPNFNKSNLTNKYPGMRNATVTTIAPTGSISIIAGCSSGIEPIFAVSFVRQILEGAKLFEVNPLFEKAAKERGFYSEKLLRKIAQTGSIQHIRSIPSDIKKIFKTALDIKPEWHVRMQAAFQKYTDNAVSKTVNLNQNAAFNDVKKAFELAYKMKCKGITAYRYGSKPQQVLYIGKPKKHVTAHAEYSGGCPGICTN